MKLVAVYIDKVEPGVIGRTIDEMVVELESHGVEALSYSFERGVIQTPRVYIQFINDLNKFVGRKFDAIFGSVPSGLYLSRLKDPVNPPVECGVVEYVMGCEGMNN